MQHSFSDFLRHGGDGQYVIARRDGRIIGRRAELSLKSTFPNYSALRADLNERLEEVISENTRMLLNALTPPDTVPTVSASDLRDVSEAKAEALNAWDTRLESIFSEYQNHPQRLRPLRTAMEERLVRAFADAMPNLFCRGFRAMWCSLILHPQQVVFLFSTQLTRYVACAL